MAVFIASLYYFSRDIKEVIFNIDNTTVIEETSLPYITISTAGEEVNLLHAYTSNLDANSVREAVTVLDEDKSFEVLINQQEHEIKKLNYEVREFVGNTLLESDSISVFKDIDGKKAALVTIGSELTLGKEYAIKITLITSESRKMYFYQRVKIYQNAYLSEKLSFIMDFHDSIKDKQAAESIVKYLEPKANADNTSLAYVNINSNFELVTWGNIKPVFLTEIVPTVLEIYPDIASVELEYFIEAEISGSVETFRVKEFYRVRYTTERMYLLNYDRWMEAMFDITLASISKSELKLGISSNNNVEHLISSDSNKVAFVRNNELWFYDLFNNTITSVFSFRQEKTDYIRDIYDQHNIRILNMDDQGNVDFMVYGYMNRGQYEGRVAVILYKFYSAEDRIQEIVYIPVNEPYQKLKERLGSFTYVNEKSIFYFHLYNKIYSYNVITDELKILADNIARDKVVYLEDINYVAWQVDYDTDKSREIHIMNLESEETEIIYSRTGYNIVLLDTIDSNVIYGYVLEKDITTMPDGRVIFPISNIEIAAVDKSVLKTYNKPGYYVTEVKVYDNIIELTLVTRGQVNNRVYFYEAPTDYIMNQIQSSKSLMEVTTRITDQALTELYLSLPDGFKLEDLPKVSNSVSTVITEDPTIRLQEINRLGNTYYAYISGGIQGEYGEAGEAIAIARDNIGIVLDDSNNIIWERGIKSVKNVLTEFEAARWNVLPDMSLENCIKLLLDYQEVNVNLDQISTFDQSAYEILTKISKQAPIRLTGITLEDVLYYVSKGRPVIAMKNGCDAVLIYGYDTNNVMLIDPSKDKVVKLSLEDCRTLFEEAGNIYLSYIEE